MPEDGSYREFLRRESYREQLLDRFDQQLVAYRREHSDASEAEFRAYAELLFVAMPGLQEALGLSQLEHKIAIALVSDRGDGLPASGPSTERDATGERLWKNLEQWTVDDYRLILAWYREPGAPAAQLAALIGYGESRWPGEDFRRGPWPDTSDLSAWEDLAPYLTGDEDDDE